MGLTEDIIYSLLSHPFIVSFAAAFIIGEESILFLAFLGGRGLIPIWIVFVMGIIGTLIADVGYYYIAKTPLISWTERFTKREEKKEKSLLRKIGESRPILLLSATKFIYGTRILTIFALSLKKHPIWKFVLDDFIALFIWSCVMVPIAWLAGRGVTRLLSIARGVEKTLAVMVIAFILFYIVYRLASKAIEKEAKIKG